MLTSVGRRAYMVKYFKEVLGNDGKVYVCNSDDKSIAFNEILVTRSSMPDLDEYVEEIRPIWESHWLTNMGAKHKQLQAELEKYLGVPHVALYTNGHLALENAIAALNLPAGGEVITTPFTFASTTHAIVRNGLVPVFCDVNDKDYIGNETDNLHGKNGRRIPLQQSC